MNFDPLEVLGIITNVAEDVILPRFQSLADHEITEKSPGDLVTIADIEAENRLGIELGALLPGSLMVGEEGVAENPGSIKALESDKPVWIVDPVDGTKNFANGEPCFAVMVALCHNQRPNAAWIYDPINKTCIYAVRGQGAFEREGDSETRLKLPNHTTIAEMTGSIGPKRTRELKAEREGGDKSLPQLIKRYRCVGREYMDLARGKLHFLRYGGNLKPWDHIPGVLIHRELGGYDAMTVSQTAYPIPYNNRNDTMLLARDYNVCTELTKLIGT